MNLSQLSKVHFVGIGGIGVSAIARLLAHRGVKISGSDVALPPRETLPHGDYYEGADSTHVPADASLLVYSPAVPVGNSERTRARELNIPELSYPEALREVTAPYNTIAVSGTHGKSTTTALLGKLFEAGGFDPAVIVGAEVLGWDHNLRLPQKGGKKDGDLFVVEACEYRRHMLHLSPQAILLTNLELDHPDYYRDLADVKDAFREYISKLTGNDILIVNDDDANIRDISRNFDGVLVRYGIGTTVDLSAHNIHHSGDMQKFDLTWKGTSLGTFTTLLPGLYNIYNILGAVATYCAYGGNTDKIQGVLDQFAGVGRRFEILGTVGGTTVISDYAHHPTALKAVTDAAVARYAGKKILTVFRPHHRERTKKLFTEFVHVISGIPHMLLVEIYDVAGREEGKDVSSRDVITAVMENNSAQDITFAKDLNDAEKLIREKMSEYDVVLVIGAGDADQLAKKLIK